MKKHWKKIILATAFLGLVVTGIKVYTMPKDLNKNESFTKELDQYVRLYKDGMGNKVHIQYSILEKDLVVFIQDYELPGYNSDYQLSRSSQRELSIIKSLLITNSQNITDFVSKTGESNKAKIRNIGVISYINGIKVMETTDGSPTWQHRSF